jgi:hypothetical protein
MKVQIGLERHQNLLSDIQITWVLLVVFASGYDRCPLPAARFGQ